MDRETRDYIEGLAQAVIEEYSIPTPVTDIDNIVENIGGTIRENVSLVSACDGSIRKNGEKSFEITVSPFQNEHRRLFTVAHELGHLFLHMGFRIDNTLWSQQEGMDYHRSGTSEQEYQANEFAASLLMPKAEYKECLDAYTSEGYVDVASIAQHFNVSIAAATNRGRFLGYLV